MLVLDLHIVEELCLVQSHNIEDLLSLLQLSSNFQILQSVGVLQTCLRRLNVLLQDSHAFLPLAHRDQQVGLQSLTFARYFKDELFQFAQQLLV